MKLSYKNTEAGVIPEDWDVKSLGQLAELTSSKRIFESDYVPFGIPFYRGKEISRLVEGKMLDDVCYISEARFTAIKAKFGAPTRGDILITAVGTLANIYVVNSDEPFYFKDGNLIWLRSIQGVEASFLGIQLRRARSSILDGAIGTSQKALTIVVLRDLTVAIPTSPEQRAIAEALSDVDALLGALDRLIAKKRNLKEAAMQQLLTGQTRLPGFHGMWEVKRLGDVAEMGSGGTPPSSVSAYYDGDIPWVSISDMTKGGKLILSTDRNLTREGFANSAAQMFPVGTVLYAMYASLGECSMAGISLCSSQAILGIRAKDRLNGDFLYYFLISLKSTVKALGQQGTQANLNKKMVQDFRLSLPPLAEQAAIAAVLSDMDAELRGLQQRRDKTRALKQGMMQELLTGRTRLV